MAAVVLDGKAHVTLDPSSRKAISGSYNEITIGCGNVLVTWDCELDSDLWIVFNGIKFHLIPHYLTARTWCRDLTTFFEENEQEE